MKEDPKQMRKDVCDYLEKRFGLDSGAFGGYEFYLASKGRVYLGPKRTIADPPIVTLGLLIARVAGSIKPTTNLLQSFGRAVRKNAVSLGKEQAIAFAKGDDIRIDPKEVTDGYVLLRYGDQPLGCGLLKGNSVKNMLPKAKRLEIKFI